MSNRGVHRAVRRIALPWRRVRAALPAVALVGAGIAFAAPTSPADGIQGVPVAKASPAVVVPRAALTVPSSAADPYVEGTQEAPGLVLPEGAAPGSSTLVTLDRTGIPVRALRAYRRGASLVGVADPSCHIDWALLGAIGRVESDHARFGGNRLDSAGVAQPGIIGIPLDGASGTARITDTDGGRLDRDSVYDRAVGPMQFIPSTWGVVGSDANGDGVKNPQDMADSAAATAVYLCSGPGDLRRPGDLRAAIMRYNFSDSYVRTVTALADAYRHGVTALPASDLPAANTRPSKAVAASKSRKTARGAKPVSHRTARHSPAPHPSTPSSDEPAVASRATANPVPTPSRPPVPAAPLPKLPVPVSTPTSTGSPALPKQICTVSALGVKTCTLVPRR